MADTPNFSARAHRPYPWASLRRLSRDEAVAESVLARWLDASPLGGWPRVRKLLRLDAALSIRVDRVSARKTSIASGAAGDAHAATQMVASAFAPAAHAIDPHAAVCRVVVAGESFVVRGSSIGVRAIVQRLIGGPEELAAPRPLGVIEQSLWSLVVATALEDLGIAGHVWPDPPASTPPESMRLCIDVIVGETSLALELESPPSLLVRARPRPQCGQSWLDRVRFDVPIVLGRSAVHRDDLARLAVRNVVTLERPVTGTLAELAIFGGGVGLQRREAALTAEVVTGYVPRDMSLPDQAHVELTVALGTTQLSLRQITELAVGQIIQLGRPLGGPFELRAAGRVLGRGELVDVDGELAVRIVSLGE